MNGNISVPFAGTIRARGRTQVEVQQAIVDALEDRAIEPQAVVSVIDQRTSLITVWSAILQGHAYPASLRPSGFLTQSPGRADLQGPGPRLGVAGARRTSRSSALWRARLRTCQQYSRPPERHDLPLSRTPDVSGVRCAWQRTAIPFGTWRISLAEAVAKSGGLRDDQADPASVFIYRGETREVERRWASTVPSFGGPSSR